MNNLSTPVALSGLESAVLQSANVLSVVGEQPVSKDEAASILASWRELNRCAEQAGEGGFGLLALVFEAVVVAFEVGAVLFGFAQVKRASAAGVNFGAGEVEGLCGVFAVGGV